MDELMQKYYDQGKNDKEIADHLADHGVITTEHRVRGWRVRMKLQSQNTAKSANKRKSGGRCAAESGKKLSEMRRPLTNGLSVMVMDKEQLENTLKDEFGRKLEPVTTKAEGKDKHRLLSGLGWRDCPVMGIGKAEG